MLGYISRSRQVVSIFVGVLAATLAFALLMWSPVASAAPPLQGEMMNPPTEIQSISPGTQSVSSSSQPSCPATAHWAITSDGGSGVYTVNASFGDGTSQTWYSQPSTTYAGHTFDGCTTKQFNQGWSVSSPGGGTDYGSSTVYYN